jgi:purine-nucleoside phosphorylase
MERKGGKNPEGKAKAEAEYKKQLEITNSFMASCYSDRFPQLFKELQQLENSALSLEREQLQKLASAIETSNSTIGTSLTNLIKQLELTQSREQHTFTDLIQIPKRYSYDSLEDLEVSNW